MKTCTFYLTRNSLAGALAGTVDVWSEKPLRVKHMYRVTWVANDFRWPGHVKEMTLEEAQKKFRTLPDTDLELIVDEQNLIVEVRA
jgi:hypothetical protein